MFRIGEFSKFAKTTIKTLRFYDEIDLFKPSFVDENGYRYYSIEDLNKLQLILELRNCGVSLQDIKGILSGADIKNILLSRKNELENEIVQNKKNLSLIDKFIMEYEKGDFMKKYQAKKIHLPEITVYYRHGIINSMEDITKFILEAGEECGKNNPDIKCSGYCFVTYCAKEFQQYNVELEYLEEVDKIGKESKNIKFKTLKATDAISVTHVGPYTKLGEAYAYAVNWVKENGYEITGNIRESYIDGCWNGTKEEDYVTEIQIPVIKK